MAHDIVDLRAFYLSPLGLFVRDVLRAKAAKIWPDLKGETILALGYGTPLLRPWLGQVGALMAMMPASQGATFWPKEGPNVCCLADFSSLPLDDNSVDRVVLLHALETAVDPQALLDEVWRVLKPTGRLLVVAPNRRGLWAYGDGTPFGQGQPYSSRQLKKILKEQSFIVEFSSPVLFAPPLTSRLGLLFARLLEAYLPRMMPSGGGVLVMEAGKQLFTPSMVKIKGAGRRLILPLPFPASRLSSNRG